MLCTVVILYTICWGPTLADDLLVGLEVICLQTYMSESPAVLKQMRMIFAIMAYANSCLNPLVYGFMSKHFRNTFKAACCHCQDERELLRTKTTTNFRLSNAFNDRSTRPSLTPDVKTALHPNDALRGGRSVSWQKDMRPTHYQSVQYNHSMVESVSIQL